MIEQFEILIWVIWVLLNLIISTLLLQSFGPLIKKLFVKIYMFLKGKKLQTEILDNDGVPWVFYPGAIGKQRNVVTIAQKGIYYYENLEKKPEYLKKFQNCIKWLMNNYVEKDNAVFWLYNFDWHYGMKAPWRSAMAQGRVLQILVRAHKLTGDSNLKELGDKVINSFLTAVKDDGITYFENNNEWWYEEYAHKNGIVSKVLNGMLVTVIGLYEYHEHFNCKKAENLFKKGIKSVISHLHLFDNDGHTFYNILKNPASEWYHNFHIELMEQMHRLTGEKIFYDYGKKWKSFSEKNKKTYFRKIIENPNHVDIAVCMGTFAICSVITLGIFYLIYFIDLQV